MGNSRGETTSPEGLRLKFEIRIYISSEGKISRKIEVQKRKIV
jgi:hypothetical protein